MASKAVPGRGGTEICKVTAIKLQLARDGSAFICCHVGCHLTAASQGIMLGCKLTFKVALKVMEKDTYDTYYVGHNWIPSIVYLPDTSDRNTSVVVGVMQGQLHLRLLCACAPQLGGHPAAHPGYT
jgi:hypothetical protein